MITENHAYLRTAIALVVAARAAYRVAEAEEEQACWAWISATADANLAGEGYRNNQRSPLAHAAYDKMRDVCKAL